MVIDKLVQGFCFSMMVLGIYFNQTGVLLSRNTMITAIVVVNMGLGWLFAHEVCPRGLFVLLIHVFLLLRRFCDKTCRFSFLSELIKLIGRGHIHLIARFKPL